MLVAAVWLFISPCLLLRLKNLVCLVPESALDRDDVKDFSAACKIAHSYKCSRMVPMVTGCSACSMLGKKGFAFMNKYDALLESLGWERGNHCHSRWWRGQCLGEEGLLEVGKDLDFACSHCETHQGVSRLTITAVLIGYLLEEAGLLCGGLRSLS